MKLTFIHTSIAWALLGAPTLVVSGSSPPPPPDQRMGQDGKRSLAVTNLPREWLGHYKASIEK